MKIRLLLLIICIFFVSCKKDTETKSYKIDNPENIYAPVYLHKKNIEIVYICSGGSSKRYHCKYNCRGLNRCSGRILGVSEEKAKNMGRTRCKICY